jgi:TRAP-type C4-dicarboxylate transport system substrate-binding protein
MNNSVHSIWKLFIKEGEMKLGKFIFVLVTICLVFSMVACAAPSTSSNGGEASPSAAEVFNWRLFTLYPRGTSFDPYFDKFASDVAKMSDGRLNIEVMYSGEGIDAEEIMSAVSTGLSEMGFPWIGLHTGEIPACNVEMGLPGVPLKPLELYVLYEEKGFKEALREIYAKHNIYWLAEGFDPGVYLISTDPINSIDDIAKMKWRSGGSYAVMMENLGASTVPMDFGETYTSLATGVIDGVAMSTLVDHRDGGWYEVAKYEYPLPVTSYQATPYIVNMDAWNALPADLQAILEDAARLNAGVDTYAALQIMEKEAIGQMTAAGLQWGPTPSASDEAAWIAAGVAAWDQIAAADADSAKLIGILKDFMKELGYID